VKTSKKPTAAFLLCVKLFQQSWTTALSSVQLSKQTMSATVSLSLTGENHTSNNNCASE
jgi:hypothetical protein